MPITLRRYVGAACALMLSLCHHVYAQPSEADRRLASLDKRYSQKMLLKNWALSVCLAEIAKDTDAKADANATASAYLEFGRQQIPAYDSLRGLVKKYIGQKYGSSIKSEFNTMKCIDLFDSMELDQLAARLARKK